MTPKRTFPNGSVIYDSVTDEEAAALTQNDPGSAAAPLSYRMIKDGAKNVRVDVSTPAGPPAPADPEPSGPQ